MNPDIEIERLEALGRYNVMHRPRRLNLEALARVAAYVAGTPMAMISLIGENEQWAAAAYGIDPQVASVPRNKSMCAQTILGTEILSISDAEADPSASSILFQTIGIRAYVGAPLITPDGHAIGSLCVMDQQSRVLGSEQKSILTDLATQIVASLEMQLYADKLEFAALTDALTGLPNRRLMLDRLRMACARAERGQGVPSLLFCDLDLFKRINDAHGHDVGDSVLVEAGKRLTRGVREHDTVARWGGDEFVILCDPLAGPEQAEIVACRLREAFRKPFITESGNISATCSIGVTRWESGCSPEKLLSRADRSMYHQKKGSEEK